MSVSDVLVLADMLVGQSKIFENRGDRKIAASLEMRSRRLRVLAVNASNSSRAVLAGDGAE